MKKKLTEKQQRDLARVAALPDDQIDTSDIPELTGRTGGIRGLFARGETQAISIRFNAADILKARLIAERKGLSYQAYIKSALHEAVEKDLAG
jgi:hypothetical protein